MREILFRGKKKTDRAWVEGDFCKPCNIVFTDIGYDEVLERDDLPVVYDCNVVPETVCQYTELLDREGNKVFENDVMKFTDEDGYDSYYFVEWRENKYIVVSAENRSAIDELDRFFCDNAVVVGNKFDWKPEV